MASSVTKDPITAARFSIVIDGVEIAAFNELQGITTEIEVTEYMASSDKEVVLKKLPGKQKPPMLTLRRGKDDSMELWTWHEAARRGELTGGARKSCSLVMYSPDGTAVARYHLEDAWPNKIEISGLKAGSSEVLMETVQITCEYIQRISA